MVCTGTEVVFWTGWIGTGWDAVNTRVVANDPVAGSWRELEPAPPLRVEACGTTPLTWTGTQIIAYGGSNLLYTR